MYPKTLQQVGGRSGQPGLAAERLQQVCDQVEIQVKRLDLLLRVVCLSLPRETVCSRGVGGAVA